jgi:hypothetical protein
MMNKNKIHQNVQVPLMHIWMHIHGGVMDVVTSSSDPKSSSGTIQLQAIGPAGSSNNEYTRNVAT